MRRFSLALAFVVVLLAFGRPTDGSAHRPQAQPSPEYHPVSVSANLTNTNTQAQIDWTIRHATEKAGLVGWQEASGAATFATLRSLPGWRTYAPVDAARPIQVPISWRTRYWRLIDAGWVKTHNGVRHISPSRYVSWVVLQRRGSTLKVARVNTHLIAHGWCHHHFATISKDGIRRLWSRHMARMRAVVSNLADKGYVVLVGGDFNRNRYPVLGDAVHYDLPMAEPTLRGGPHYDYLMHPVDDRRVSVLDYESDPEGASTHSLVRARYAVRP